MIGGWHWSWARAPRKLIILWTRYHKIMWHRNIKGHQQWILFKFGVPPKVDDMNWFQRLLLGHEPNLMVTEDKTNNFLYWECNFFSWLFTYKDKTLFHIEFHWDIENGNKSRFYSRYDLIFCLDHRYII